MNKSIPFTNEKQKITNRDAKIQFFWLIKKEIIEKQKKYFSMSTRKVHERQFYK